MIRVTDDIAIDEAELEFAYTRASGPGGQNVNKVSTAVQLRFDARRSLSLPDSVAARLIRLAGARASQDGVILISAQRFRSQERNRADAVARLVALIERAAQAPKPRKATRPSRAAREARLQDKHRRSANKAGRRKIGSDD